ncbi:MAG TPA: hypothetical protein DDZ51_04515 [Planctomycetaceae bacterium]|nr:hypothetical protein [Planctomycetaceae bacterium]
MADTFVIRRAKASDRRKQHDIVRRKGLRGTLEPLWLSVRSSSSHPAEAFLVGNQYRTSKRDVHLTDDLWPRFSNRISKRPLRAADPVPNAMRSYIK